MKNLTKHRSVSPFSIKFSLKMKLTTFLLVIAFFNIHANNYAQKTKITLDLDNVTIREVLSEIESSTDFKFLFNHNDVNVNKIVTVKAKKESVESILTKMFLNSEITFKLRDKQIILKSETHDESNSTSALELTQQQKEISGIVTDAAGLPLPGATILVEGTNNGTTSDFDGNFTLSVSEDAQVIIVSFVGFVTQHIVLENQTKIDVILQEDTANLDEVIVTGYTAERKSDLTGAVAIVDMSNVVSQPVASIDNMLQGQVAGVNVVSSGAPGGGSAVRIRGYSTIRNNDPLYIIDGVPTTSGINLLNPNDIASLQVLKDASSSSIYGSRAANGVIIITTKKGKTDYVKFTFDTYAGIQNASNLPRLLNAQEYGDVYWEGYGNDGIPPNNSIYGSGPSPVIPAFLDAPENTIPSSDTKWLDEIFNSAVVQSYDLNISKGGEKSHSMFSVGYYNQEGIVKHTGFDRITARLNSDYKLFNDRVTVGENLTVAFSKTRGTSTNSLLGNAVYDAFRIPSIAPVYDINGNFTGYPPSDTENPLGNLYRGKDNDLRRAQIFGNMFVEISILESLKFKSNFGINYTSSKGTSFSPTYKEPNSQRDINSLSVSDVLKFDWVWSNTLNYNQTFNDKHNVNVLVGLESIENSYEGTSASVQGLPTNELNIRVLNAGDQGTQTNEGDKIEYSLFSYFGKVNYIFNDKYLFSATVRRDGTSKLLDNRWGTFPALSAGWKISDEDFFNSDGVFSNLKLRVGWGITGNQDIPPYQTVSGFKSNPRNSNYAIDGSQNSTQTGFTLSRNANPDLKWETTTQTNIGLDFGFLDNSLTLTLDYFNKRTEDLLLFKTLPPDISGMTNRGQWSNVGEMKNNGFEFGGNYQSDRTKDFSFNIGVNFAVIENELLALDEDIDFIESDPGVLHSINFDQPTSRTAVGQPIASFFGHVVDGIFQSDADAASSIQPSALAGDFIFKDLNNDGIIDDEDRTFIGSPHADFTYGINFAGKYKFLDFTLFFQGSQGNDIYDLSRYYTDFFNLANYNKSGRILNAWSPQNTGTDLSRVSLNDLNNNIRPSSYYVRDGSYFRLKTFQVGYTFLEKHAKKIKASNIRLYFEAYNLFTITNYDGLDPEIGLQSYTSDDRNLDIGVDRGIYPASQTFTIGLNLNF